MIAKWKDIGIHMTETKIIVKGIVEYQGNYLIVEKWYDDRINEPYQWEFIDGIVDVGDVPNSTVCELVHEKTALEVEVKNLLYTWSYSVGSTAYLGLAYLCETNSDMVILSEELNGYKWVEYNQFDKYITNLDILKDIKENFKQ